MLTVRLDKPSNGMLAKIVAEDEKVSIAIDAVSQLNVLKVSLPRSMLYKTRISVTHRENFQLEEWAVY